MPQRIQRRRTKGWRMPPNTVSVTRPGIFGNPFVIPKNHPADKEHAIKAAVASFHAWLKDDQNPFTEEYPEKRKRLLENLHKLKGKNLACYCPPGATCHADVLLKLANG